MENSPNPAARTIAGRMQLKLFMGSTPPQKALPTNGNMRPQ